VGDLAANYEDRLPVLAALVLSWDDGGEGVHARTARAVREILDEASR
jgi:hypothetical protein